MSLTWAERLLSDKAHGRNWLILIGLVALSTLLWNVRFTVGVAAGGVLANLSFLLLHQTLRKMFVENMAQGKKTPGVFGVIIKYYIRFVFTGLIVLVLLKYKLADPIGLLIGLSVIVINLTATGFYLAHRMRVEEAI